VVDNRPVLQCSLVAQDILRGTDPGDPRLTVFGVLRVIFAPRFPAVHGRLTVFDTWLGRVGGTFTEEVKILSPDGSEVIGEARTEFALEGRLTFQAISHFRNLVFLVPGDYQVQVLLDGVEMIRYPLTLVHVGESRPEIGEEA
jgi:hypothetical protein